MRLSDVSDLFGVLGGIVLIYSGGKLLITSYRYGKLAKLRWTISRKLLPFSEADITEWTKHQKTQYILKLRGGNQTEINTALDYINFLDWDDDFDDAVSHIISDLKIDEQIRIKACNLLSQKLTISKHMP